MEQKKIDRINQLTQIARTRLLTEEEQTERTALRNEYIQSMKASLTAALAQTYIEYPDGTKKKVIPQKPTTDQSH